MLTADRLAVVCRPRAMARSFSYSGEPPARIYVALLPLDHLVGVQLDDAAKPVLQLLSATAPQLLIVAHCHSSLTVTNVTHHPAPVSFAAGAQATNLQ